MDVTLVLNGMSLTSFYHCYDQKWLAHATSEVQQNLYSPELNERILNFLLCITLKSDKISHVLVRLLRNPYLRVFILLVHCVYYVARWELATMINGCTAATFVSQRINTGTPKERSSSYKPVNWCSDYSRHVSGGIFPRNFRVPLEISKTCDAEISRKMRKWNLIFILTYLMLWRQWRTSACVPAARLTNNSSPLGTVPKWRSVAQEHMACFLCNSSASCLQLDSLHFVSIIVLVSTWVSCSLHLLTYRAAGKSAQCECITRDVNIGDAERDVAIITGQSAADYIMAGQLHDGCWACARANISLLRRQ